MERISRGTRQRLPNSNEDETTVKTMGQRQRCEGRQDKEATDSSQSKEKMADRQRDKRKQRAIGANDDFEEMLASAWMGEGGLKESEGERAGPASV